MKELQDIDFVDGHVDEMKGRGIAATLSATDE